MKSIIQKFIVAGCTVLTAGAQIDSGGGKAQVGSLTNHASLGGIVATGALHAGAVTNHSGLIEVLYAAAAFTTEADANSNDIPDSWEQEYFAGQGFDPNADSDGDGTSNRMEYIAGTLPTSRSSVFRPLGSQNGTVFTMPMATVAGRTYKVYVTRNLTDWHLQQTIVGDGTTKTFSFDEMTVPSGPLHSPTHPSSYFFRVEISLP
jgi:hypothetical protein